MSPDRGKGSGTGLKRKLLERSRALKSQLVSVYYAYQDKRVGFLPKALIALCLGYALSPIDLIPDFIPVLGYLDDLVIVPALLALAIRLIPAEVMTEAKARAENEPLRLKDNWAAGVLVLAIWLAVLAVIAKAIFRA